METFDECRARIKAEVRRDELDEGIFDHHQRFTRYCPMCDEWMRVVVCKRCGMDTEKMTRMR